jgi:hypothetical protein
MSLFAIVLEESSAMILSGKLNTNRIRLDKEKKGR